MSFASPIDFRLPPSEVNRHFTRYAVGVPLVLLVYHLVFGSGLTANLLYSMLVFEGILAVAYFISRRAVWVSLSSSGITGVGWTGRRISIAWAEPITMTSAVSSGMKCVKLRASADNGIVRSAALSIHVAEAILASEPFRIALKELAPPKHPLRSRVEGVG
jgi:hypothetical protein